MGCVRLAAVASRCRRQCEAEFRERQAPGRDPVKHVGSRFIVPATAVMIRGCRAAWAADHEPRVKASLWVTGTFAGPRPIGYIGHRLAMVLQMR